MINIIFLHHKISIYYTKTLSDKEIIYCQSIMVQHNNSNNNQEVKALNQFAIELNRQASNGKLDPVNILKL